MSAQAQPRITPEQYLALERAAEFKSEYWDGQIYAMSGVSRAHILITGSISGELRQLLKGQSCEVSVSEMKVRVSPRTYSYPDVIVTCGEPQFADDQQDVLLNPLVIVEVLSPSTEAYDRGLKSTRYRAIPSLRQYILVRQTEPRIEILTRQSSGDWLLHDVVGLESSCPFESLKCEVPMAEIYRQIQFDPPEETE